MNHFDDLVYEERNSLSHKTCQDIIQRFRHDDRKRQGVTTSGRVLEQIKKSIDLSISDLDEWEDIDKILFGALNKGLETYSDYIYKADPSLDKTAFIHPLSSSEGLRDSGYNVKRYRPGDYYHWHCDCQATKGGWVRTVAAIWYLNEVEEGGHTELAYGRSITPETGKLLLFPATWNFPHRGVSPIKGNKYIITSFVSTNQLAVSV